MSLSALSNSKPSKKLRDMPTSKKKQIPQLPVAQQLALLGGILFLIFAGTLTPKLISLLSASETAPASTLESERSQDEVQESEGQPFKDVALRAKSAYVWDVKNQRALYKKEESEQLPLASVTKLMTALVANEVLEESKEVEIDTLSIRQDGDSGLFEGEVFDRLSLSDLVLMSSSNDGAFALAAAAGNALIPGNGASTFVDAMNIRAKEIGLSHTYFKNPTGLDISLTEAGAYGTARDVAFLMEYIVQHHPEILTFTQEDQARVYSRSGNHYDAENTNHYVKNIPGLIGSKTGYTDLAGGNLVVAFNAGLDRPIIAVVLGSTQQERFTDIIKLVEESQQYVAATQ